ncbi:MAG: tetratricopeptide repeat protein [Microgenomates group bacterium]
MIDASKLDDAIKAALQQDWKTAIELNTEILKTDKKNVDAHNRLGFAYLKSGQIKKAKEIFEKVLTLDKYNQIATKNLQKLLALKKGGLLTANSSDISPLLFLEEPGKTKVVDCINAAPMNVLTGLTCGQEVYLKPKKHTIEIRDQHEKYLGALPDDVAFKMIKFITAGNTYSIFVKGISKNCISVFIRELKRGKKLQNQPSFIGTTNYMPYQRDTQTTENAKSTEDEQEEEQQQEA